MSLNPILCVTENEEVSDQNNDIINSIVKKMDVIDSNNSNNGDTNITEYVKKDNFKKIIGDIRVDILGILNVLGMINKNVIKENNDNKELFKEIEDLKTQIKILNETIKIQPVVYNHESVILLKDISKDISKDIPENKPENKPEIISKKPEQIINTNNRLIESTKIMPNNRLIDSTKIMPNNKQQIEPTKIIPTTNINNKNFVNNINTQRMTNTNVKTPSTLINKNVDKRR